MDQRYFELGLIDFVKEKGITDLLFLNNIFAVNTDVRIRELSRIQNQSYQPISQQPVQPQQPEESKEEVEEQREEMSNPSEGQAEKQEQTTQPKTSKTEDPPRRLGRRE